MKRWCLGLSLISCVFFMGACNEMEQQLFSSPAALMSVKSGDSTPDEVTGYWEARLKVSTEGQQRFEHWRLRVSDDRLALAVVCQEGEKKSQTGTSLKVKLEDQDGRTRVVFQEGFDFRVVNEEFRCGGFIPEESSTFLYVDSFRLEVSPMFQDMEFEKISDLEEDSEEIE